jgi:hypothetical protein
MPAKTVDPAFIDTLPGHLPPDPVSQARLPRVEAIMQAIIADTACALCHRRPDISPKNGPPGIPDTPQGY